MDMTKLSEPITAIPPLPDDVINTAVRTVGGLIALLVALGVGAYYLAFDSASILKGTLHAIPWSPDPEYICALFLFLHGVRYWLGLNFLDTDESFLDARRAKFPVGSREDKRRGRADAVLRITGYASVGLLPAFITGRFGVLGFLSMLWVQSAVLILFVYLYRDVLFRLDRQREANIFIFIGDLAFVSFTLIVTFFLLGAPWLVAYLPKGTHYASAFLLLSIGSFAAVFIGEFFSQYLKALLLRIRSLTA